MRGSAAPAPRLAPRLLRTLATASIAVVALLLAAPASAHEERTSEHYNLVVGFGDEPAYAGARNSVQAMVTDTHGQPVRDLRGGSLKVMLMAAGQQREFPLEPYFGDSWGTPGDYRAFFIPTVAGQYTFHVTGT